MNQFITSYEGLEDDDVNKAFESFIAEGRDDTTILTKSPKTLNN
jgi:hypothetical protein